MESTELSTRNTGLIRTVDDLSRIGKMMAISGYFSDARDAAQAAVKVQAGLEMGFGPFASMTGIHIIQGRPAVGANLMASAVKANPRYDYRVRKMDDSEVIIEFFEFEGGKKESIGTSSFTIDDARKAQVKNLEKFPRNMLFARAMSNGIRWFCPDVFMGNPTYTPEELGAQVDEDGYVTVEAPAQKVEVLEPEPEPAEAPKKRTKEDDFDAHAFLANWTKPSWVAEMSRKNAESMTDRDNNPYCGKTTYKLVQMLNQIMKAMDTADDDQRDIYGLKASAICEILQLRKLDDQGITIEPPLEKWS